MFTALRHEDKSLTYPLGHGKIEYATRRCGYSSSVERQLPKLNRRVRLPLSAPAGLRPEGAFRAEVFSYSFSVKIPLVFGSYLDFFLCR